MGADLIVGHYWFRVGEPEQRKRTNGAGAEYEFTELPPLLDWEGGRTRATVLVEGYTEEEIDTYLEYHQEVADDLEEDASLDEKRRHILADVLANLKQVESMFTGVLDGAPAYWRDISISCWPSGVGYLVTGGMSWGDLPTEAFDILDKAFSEEYTPGGEGIYRTIGFIDNPHEQIGLLS